MTRYRWFGLISLVGLGLLAPAAAPVAEAAPKAGPKAPPAAPMTKTPIKLTPEGFRLGIQAADVAIFYDKIIDQDYVPKYKKVAIGPEMKALDAEVSDQKAAFRRGRIDFGELPTGIDNTPLRGEYGYKNNESMMSLSRGGATRFFFFVSQRLWKIYDTVPLKEGGELGASYKDAIAALTQRFGVGGRVLAADPGAGRSFNEVAWMDGSIRVRALDRSDENMVGLVFEERATADRLAAFRATHKEDPGAIDPSIQQVTRQGPAVDPNAKAADAYTGRAHSDPSGPPPAAPPDPKKKK
jgi:hypothetical protein